MMMPIPVSTTSVARHLLITTRKTLSFSTIIPSVTISTTKLVTKRTFTTLLRGQPTVYIRTLQHNNISFPESKFLFYTTSAATMVRQITSAKEFKDVTAVKNKLVVIDFYATWCGPCKVIAPKIDQFSEDFPDVDFYKIDVDELQDVAAELEVRAMPTFVCFKDGKSVQHVVGANQVALLAAIERHRPSPSHSPSISTTET